jgi:cbb3-type cytochrome oxidase subunit 3
MKEGLTYFTDTYLTSMGLLIFFLFFLGVVWWVSRAESRKLYRYAENLPFDNGVKHEPQQ